MQQAQISKAGGLSAQASFLKRSAEGIPVAAGTYDALVSTAESVSDPMIMLLVRLTTGSMTMVVAFVYKIIVVLQCM